MHKTSELIFDITSDIIVDKIKGLNTEIETTRKIIAITADIITDKVKKLTDITDNRIINSENINIYKKDKYINIASLYNTNNNTLIYNIIKENLLPSYDPENDFQIISETVEDVLFQITTSKNQLKALYNNSLNNYNLSILDITVNQY